MEMLANAIGLITGIVSLVCYILVIVKMFQHGQTVLGIVCLVLLLCCGLGGLIASLSTTIQHVEPWLTLHGLRLIYEKNAPTT